MNAPEPPVGIRACPGSSNTFGLIIIPAELARIPISGAAPLLVCTRTVDESTTSTLVTSLSACLLKLFAPRCRSRFALTDSASNGVPSWYFHLSMRVRVRLLPPSPIFHFFASIGRGSPSASMWISES